MTTIKDVIQYLEQIAPPIYQESYDNAGLIVGDTNWSVKGILTCLDSTEAVVEEAIEKKCNLIIAHHPIIFKGLKKINGKNYVERVIIKAIKADIAIYAIHTNLDNVLYKGVNAEIAKQLALEKVQILAPKHFLKKLFVSVPVIEREKVYNALSVIDTKMDNHKPLLYETTGTERINGKKTDSIGLEMVFPKALQQQVVHVLKGAVSQQLSYSIMDIENPSLNIGSGIVGDLKEAMEVSTFFAYLKDKMQVDCIRHTAWVRDKIKRVAVCGGAGGFLLPKAIGQDADVFITADYKYHEFFDADKQIIIADIGHYESEQYTIRLLYELLNKKFLNFATHCTKVKTNPVHYFF